MAGFAIAPMILSTLASGVNMMNQSKVNTENLKNQNALQQRAFSYQDQNNINMYSTLRKSLEKAGLNVNSNFGGYPTTTAPSSPLANMEAPQLDATGPGNLLQQSPLVKAQTDLLSSQKAKTDEEAGVASETKRKLELENKKLGFDTDDNRMRTMFDLFVNEKLANIGKTTSETDIYELKRDYQYWENKYQKETYEDRVKTLTETLGSITANKELTQEQKNTEIAKQADAYASAAAHRAAAKKDYAAAKEIMDLLEWKKEDLIASKSEKWESAKYKWEARKLVIAQTMIAQTEADWKEIEKSLSAMGFSAKAVKNILPHLKKLHSLLK